MPGDDLLGGMSRTEEHGGRLSAAELLASTLPPLVSGRETTTNPIGNGLWALLRNPDQHRLLHDATEYLPGTVEELLGFDSPVQLGGRLAKEDLGIGSKQVGAGQVVRSLIGAANRGPARFPDRTGST
ncbi:MAG: cytochrome P450 [Chloroflexota bacterium]|nr:cytochrome P450 [Chloroflexota bacterium]